MQRIERQVDAKSTENLTDEVDLLVVIGGDGTILRAASLLNSKTVPVLPINLGRVGFMAEVLPDEAISELQSVMDGTALFVNRMMLEVNFPRGKTARVLNDVVIHWAGIAAPHRSGDSIRRRQRAGTEGGRADSGYTHRFERLLVCR